MSERDNGGPAFPGLGEPADRWWDGECWRNDNPHQGMSLRDYFAANASAEDLRCQAEILRNRLMQEGNMGILPDDWSATARYMHADSMLKARQE